MRNTKIFKIILLVACMASFMALLATSTACREKDDRPTIEGVSFAGEEEKSGPQFLEGALTEILVNETVRLNEYIDYVNESYTITVTDEDGNVTDLTSKTYWVPKTPGEYTLTYTVKRGDSKGKSELVLTVTNPELTWEFNIQNRPYNYGDTLNFNKYFGSMNIFTSLPNCEYIMDSVEVDGEVIDLTGETEYTFASRSDHTFKFHAEAPDGQICEGREVISIKYVDEEYLAELEDMGISLSGDLYVERGGFTMVEGSYCNGNNVWLRRENGPHNMSYLAYNGDYGIGSYVKLDFTGKNLPIFSFFRDEYSNSIFDGTKGVVFTGGFTNNQGAAIHKELNARGTMYGPYMLHEYDRGASDTTTIGTTDGSSGMPLAGSFVSLQDGVRYRIIAGFSGIRVGKANLLGTLTPVDTVFLDFDCVIINLDTKEIFNKFRVSSYGLNALGFSEIPVKAEDNDFFKGNIVLYGNHGMRMTFDAIYPIITGRTFDEICAEELELSQFKEGAETFILSSGVTLNVSDYVDTTNEEYLFFYRDEDGNTFDVEGETFTIDEAGSYILYYSDGERLLASLPLTVADFSDELESWIVDSGINLYGINDLTEDHSITLKSGTAALGATYNGPNPGNSIDQAYVAFDGDYSYNDYIAFDFTGKNMPEVAFFAKNYNNSMYYQDGGKQGMVFTSGVTNNDGSIDKNILFGGTAVNVDSPFMIANAYDNWLMEGGSVNAKIARANLVDGKHYRVILGYTHSPVYKADNVTVDRVVPTIHWYLYDLDTNTVVEESSLACWNFFTGNEAKVNKMTADDLVGSIVLYGKFGTELAIDKLYGVFEDTTIEKIANGLNGAETYDVTFIGTKGEVLKTLSDVPCGTRVSYGGQMPVPAKTEDAGFTYEYKWNRPLGLICEDTTYRIEVIATPKSNVKTHYAYFADGGIKLNSSTIGDGASYTIGNTETGYVNQSFVAIEGSFGLGDYIALDFTGKNMPELAFFVGNYNNSMYTCDGSKNGIVVATGITYWNGELNSSAFAGNTEISVSGPYMAYFKGISNKKSGYLMGNFTGKLARANLVDGKRYRVIIGFSLKTEKVITLNYILYDLDEGAIVEEVSEDSYGVFNNPEYFEQKASSLSGSILLYGRFGVETIIDGICGIYEDSTIDEIATELGVK